MLKILKSERVLSGRLKPIIFYVHYNIHTSNTIYIVNIE